MYGVLNQLKYYLVDNQYQQKCEVLYTFVSNKSYTYLLSIETSKLLFLKTYNTDFVELIVTFTDQNGSPLDIEGKVNLTLLINKQKQQFILQNPEQEYMSKDVDFFHCQ